jgi:hypothetical protein
MLTRKQSQFCKFIVEGSSGTDAYQKAFGTKTKSTCRFNASKLLKSDAIKEKLHELRALARKITEKANQKAADQIAAEEIMGVQERMAILTKIARGSIPLIKPMVCDGSIHDIEVVPDWMDRKNAIAELNKMDGTYAPEKKEHNIKMGLDAIEEKYEE